MSCARITASLSAYVDGELSLRRRGRVEQHLGRCAPCAAELEALRRLSLEVRDLERGEATLSPSFDATLAARVAMLDAQLDQEERARAARRPTYSLAGMLLIGLALGLTASRLVPGFQPASSDPGTDSSYTRTMILPASAPTGPTAKLRMLPEFGPELDAFRPSASDLTADEFVQLVNKQGGSLADLAEDIYVAVVEFKQAGIVPGKDDEERLHYLRCCIESLQLEARSADLATSLIGSPARLEPRLQQAVENVAADVQYMSSVLADGGLDADERQAVLLDPARRVLSGSALLGETFSALNTRPLSFGGPWVANADLRGRDAESLARLAMKLRYHCLRRQQALADRCVQRLEEQLGSGHPYIAYCRHRWVPLAGLRSDSPIQLLQELLLRAPEMEQPELLLWLSRGDVTRRFRMHIEVKWMQPCSPGFGLPPDGPGILVGSGQVPAGPKLDSGKK